jgi:hypothetical protein
MPNDQTARDHGGRKPRQHPSHFRPTFLDPCAYPSVRRPPKLHVGPRLTECPGEILTTATQHLQEERQTIGSPRLGASLEWGSGADSATSSGVRGLGLAPK